MTDKSSVETLTDTADYAYREIIKLVQKLSREGVSCIAIMGALDTAQRTLFEDINHAQKSDKPPFWQSHEAKLAAGDKESQKGGV